MSWRKIGEIWIVTFAFCLSACSKSAISMQSSVSILGMQILSWNWTTIQHLHHEVLKFPVSFCHIVSLRGPLYLCSYSAVPLWRLIPKCQFAQQSGPPASRLEADCTRFVFSSKGNLGTFNLHSRWVFLLTLPMSKCFEQF